jgi:hypothetical protein
MTDYTYRYQVIDELTHLVQTDRQSIKTIMHLDDTTLDILEHLTTQQRKILAENFYSVFKFNDEQINVIMTMIKKHH